MVAIGHPLGLNFVKLNDLKHFETMRNHGSICEQARQKSVAMTAR